MKFKVGDRVEVTEVLSIDSKYGLKVNDVGFVTRHNGGTVYFVDFINGIFKGRCGTSIDSDGTYQMFGYQLELAKDEQEITIKQKGRKVVAVMTADGKYAKSANAKCNPTDEFDFNIGAKLAFSRLMGEEETKANPLTIKDFKIGDKVRLKKGLVVDRIYGNLHLWEGMKHDDVMVIKSGSMKKGYFTDKSLYYSHEMLEPVEATKPSLSIYTDKELIDELAKRWEDKQ